MRHSVRLLVGKSNWKGRLTAKVVMKIVTQLVALHTTEHFVLQLM